MMVVMKPGHTREQFEDVMNRIREAGMEGRPIVGVERTVIAVVGTERIHPELADDLEVMEGVESTVKISSPYKLSSREVSPHEIARYRVWTIIMVNRVADDICPTSPPSSPPWQPALRSDGQTWRSCAATR